MDKWDRFVVRVVFGALLGLGLGLATNLGGAAIWAVSPEAVREPCKWVFRLAQWPVLHLEELDRHRGGRILYENVPNYLLLLALYWMLVGELILPVILWCRAFRQRRKRKERSASFPVRIDN